MSFFDSLLKALGLKKEGEQGETPPMTTPPAEGEPGGTPPQEETPEEKSDLGEGV